MRRHRVLRTPSAQSLCVFCACRLGVDVPSTQLAPFVSANARRTFSNSASRPQDESSGSGSNGSNNNAPAFEFDPKSSLTRAEQQEKAQRLAVLQERQTRSHERKFQREQQNGPKFSSSNEKLSKDTHKGRSIRIQQYGAQTELNHTRGEKSAASGNETSARLSQDLFRKHQTGPVRKLNVSTDRVGSQNETGSAQAGATGNFTIHKHDSNHPAHLKPRGKAEQSRGRAEQPQGRAERPRGEPDVFVNRRRPARVAKPDFLKSAATANAQEVSGWGLGTTETKPLEYGDLSQSRPTSLQEQKFASESQPGSHPTEYDTEPSLGEQSRVGVMPPHEQDNRQSRAESSQQDSAGGFGLDSLETSTQGSSSQENAEMRAAIEQNRQGWAIGAPRQMANAPGLTLQPNKAHGDVTRQQPNEVRAQNPPPDVPQRRPQLQFSMSDATDYKYDRDYANQELAYGSRPQSGFPQDRYARSEASMRMANRYNSSTPEAPQSYWQGPVTSSMPVSERDEYNPEYRISESRTRRAAPAQYDANWSSFEEEQYGDAGPDPTQHRPVPAPDAASGHTQSTPRHYGDEVAHNRYGQGDPQDQPGFNFDDSYDGIPLDADRRRPEPHPSEISRYPQHVPRNARTFGFEEEHRRDRYYAEQRPPPLPRYQTRREDAPPSRFSGSFQNYENIQYDAPPEQPPNSRAQQYQRPFMGVESLGSFESDDYYASQYQYPESRRGAGSDSQSTQTLSQPRRRSFGAPHYQEADQRQRAYRYGNQEPSQYSSQQPRNFQDYERRGVSQPFGDSYGPPSQTLHNDDDDGGQASLYDRQPAPFRTGTSGYRAVPIDMRELDPSLDQRQEDNSANWQHLRRRNSEPTSPPAQYQSHREPRQALSVQDIDQIFANHKQQRDTFSPPMPPPPPTSNTSSDPFGSYFDNKPRETRKCARCGEVGHIARNCSMPARQRRHDAPPFNKGSSEQQRFENGAKIRYQGRDDQVGGDDQANTITSYRPAYEKPQESEVDDRPARFAVSDSGSAETETSKRSSRRDQWVGDEDDMQSDDLGSGRRKDRRGARRQANDEEDEDQSARDEYRARKAERQTRDEVERQAKRRAAQRVREERKAGQATPITLPEFISVQNLSQTLGIRYEEFVERLEELGYDDVFPGKTLNSETSGMIAMEYNFEPTFDAGAQEEEERDLKRRPEVEDKEFLPVRPPVVTIMGHVDHGKTTILDYLRKSFVAAGEAGGITQHIGAFSVPLSSSGKTITFLDTPGHAAFLAMRQRGANVTDIIILVVAADDSVKPQTLEALKHAKAAGVPIIVAVNKIDKEEADVERCKQDLARHGIEIEDFGGDTQVVCVSGKTGRGMDELEESVVTLSEILDHRAEIDGPVEGWVLEATTRKAGRVATVLVRRGTLRPGSVIVAGKTWARVRTLKNEGGKTLNEVGPGMPVEVDGWKDQPMAGDEVLQAPSEQKANSVVDYRLELEERSKTAQDMEAINEARRIEQEKREKERAAQQAAKRAATTITEDGEPVLVSDGSQTTAEETQSGQQIVPFIVKADVSGSAEAVSAYILSVSSPLIAPQVLQSAVGPVHESDIELANAAQAHIIAFNLAQDPDMNALAESRDVKILENNIIYRVLDDVKAMLEEKLPPIVSQRVLGEAEVGAAFEIGVGGRKKVRIAGCKVRNGVIGKSSRARVTRNGEKVYDGTINSLKNVKKDVQEMRKGSECGMGFEGWEGFEVGDQIQTYVEVEEKRKL